MTTEARRPSWPAGRHRRRAGTRPGDDPRRPRGRPGPRRRTRPGGTRRLAGPAGGQDRDPRPASRTGRRVDWTAGPLTFRDRAAIPPRADLAGGPWRIVPGGTAVRRGAHLGEGVVVMPPSYINVGAWVGPDSMVDSHVLVGSCAQIGARVHLAAGVTIGGVLEPPGARPVIVEDDAFVGAGQRPARGRARRSWRGHRGRSDADRHVAAVRPRPRPRPRGNGRRRRSSSRPERSSIPGSRVLHGRVRERSTGCRSSVALLVKDRDAGTSARVALEDALR